MARVISVRLPEKELKSVDRLAKRQERTRSYVIQKAVEMYVAEEGDYRIALQRLEDSADPIISSRQLKRRLNSK
jgi:RHH-type rel operon transcriptional repressor/antitoxin RelB